MNKDVRKFPKNTKNVNEDIVKRLINTKHTNEEIVKRPTNTKHMNEDVTGHLMYYNVTRGISSSLTLEKYSPYCDYVQETINKGNKYPRNNIYQAHFLIIIYGYKVSLYVVF